MKIYPHVFLPLLICCCSTSYELTRKVKPADGGADYETSAEDWAPIQVFDGRIDSNLTVISSTYLGKLSERDCPDFGYQIETNSYDPPSILEKGEQRVEIFYNHFLARHDEGIKGAGATLLLLEWDNGGLTKHSRYFTFAQKEPCNLGGIIDSVSKSSSGLLVYGKDPKNRIIWFDIHPNKLKNSSLIEMKGSFLKVRKEGDR